MPQDNLYKNKSTRELEEAQKYMYGELSGAAISAFMFSEPDMDLKSELEERKKEGSEQNYPESGKALEENLRDIFITNCEEHVKQSINIFLTSGGKLAQTSAHCNQVLTRYPIIRLATVGSVSRSGGAAYVDILVNEQKTAFINNMIDQAAVNLINDLVDNKDNPAELEKHSYNLGRVFNLDEDSMTRIAEWLQLFQQDGDPEVQMAAAKVKLYNDLLEGSLAKKAVANVLSEHVSKHSSDKKSEALREDVFKIASSVINAKNPIEVKGLQDASARIVDAHKDKNTLGFRERVEKIWRSFTDSLPSLRAATKEMDKIVKSYVTDQSNVSAARSVSYRGGVEGRGRR